MPIQTILFPFLKGQNKGQTKRIVYIGHFFEQDMATLAEKIRKSSPFQVRIWWGKVDSNHRRHCQQIYSLSPLATREFPHMRFSGQNWWSWWTDSNPRPADYKSAALPTELHQHRTGLLIIANGISNVKFYFRFFHFFCPGTLCRN